MKFRLALIISMGCIITAHPQETQEIDTTDFSTYYYRKKSTFEVMPNKKDEIIFVGNSITDQCDWGELFEDKHVINRGISGDRTDGILYRLDEITESNPSKIFLLIGTNDIAYGRSVEYILHRSNQIIKAIKKSSPKTELYIQSILPVYDRADRPSETIIEINKGLHELAFIEHVTYIDLFSHFTRKNTVVLDKKYSIDGLHLNGIGYLLWKDLIKGFME